MSAEVEVRKKGGLQAGRALPAGWRWVRLGDILLETRNGLYKPDSFYGSGTPILKMFNIGRLDGSWDLSRVDLIELTESERRLFEMRTGDILLNRVNSRELVGKCAVVDQRTQGAVFESKNIRLRINRHMAEPLFVATVLNSSVGRNQVDSALKQIVGQATVNAADLVGLEIPLPPLPEQQRIAAVLTEQMAAVERARQAAEGRLGAIRALPLALTRSTFEAPEANRWETKRLGDVLIPHKETIHPGDRKSGTATFVGLEHLEPHTGRRLGSVALDLARLTGRKPTFRCGQIVYGYLRPYLNKVWVAEFDGCSSVDQFAYEVRSDIADVGFVAWFMRSPTYLRRSAIMATTGQLPRIGTEQIAAVKIGLPSLPEQKRISSQLSAQVSAFDQARQAAEAELASINALPAALLRRAFSGEL